MIVFSRTPLGLGDRRFRAPSADHRPSEGRGSVELQAEPSRFGKHIDRATGLMNFEEFSWAIPQP